MCLTLNPVFTENSFQRIQQIPDDYRCSCRCSCGCSLRVQLPQSWGFRYQIPLSGWFRDPETAALESFECLDPKASNQRLTGKASKALSLKFQATKLFSANPELSTAEAQAPLCLLFLSREHGYSIPYSLIPYPKP